MDETPKHPGGRPSKYDPIYCEQVVTFLAEGYSLTSFAAEIDVSRSTIGEWMKEHPEFSAAVSRAQARKARWWETTLLSIAKNGGGPGAATAAIFGIKNAAPDDFREKQEVAHSNPDGSALALPVFNIRFGVPPEVKQLPSPDDGD